MSTEQLESEIRFIKKVMDDSRRATLDNGKYYILWGMVIGIASIGTYIGVKNNWEENFINWVWMNSIVIGWILSIIFGIRDRKKERHKTFAGKMIAHTWIGAGITMALLAFVGITTKVIPYDAICPLVAAMLGGANYVSSRVQRSGLILSVAFGWWAGSIVLFLMNGIEIMLVNGVMLILFSLIPGFILYFKWKKELLPNIQ